MQEKTIRGLIATVTGSELKRMAEELAEYNSKKHEEISLKIVELEKFSATIKDTAEEPTMPDFKTFSSTAPRNRMDEQAYAMKEQAKTYLGKKRYFEFLASHVLEDHLYNLDTHDLKYLGISIDKY